MSDEHYKHDKRSKEERDRPSDLVAAFTAPPRPSREAIRQALTSAIEEAEIWVERSEFNEFKDPNAPAAAEASRQEIVTLRWIAAHFEVPLSALPAEPTPETSNG